MKKILTRLFIIWIFIFSPEISNMLFGAVRDTEIFYRSTEEIVIQKTYPWVTHNLYKAIEHELKKYPVLDPFLVVALIEKESRVVRNEDTKWITSYEHFLRRSLATGPTVTVRLKDSQGNYYKKKVSARGLMQVMPFNCKYSANDLYNPEKNVKCGIKVLAYCKNRFKTVRKTLRCYNSGPNSNYYNEKYIKEISLNYLNLTELYTKKLGDKK